MVLTLRHYHLYLTFLLLTPPLVYGARGDDNLPIKIVWTEKGELSQNKPKVTIQDLHGSKVNEMFQHYKELRTEEVENSIRNKYQIYTNNSQTLDPEKQKNDIVKKFIHHTIEAVSSNYDYNDCGVTIENGTINLQFCPGPLTIITTTHIGVYSCNSVKSLNVYGPVIIKSEKCTEQVLSKGDCKLALSHQFLDHDCHIVEVDSGVSTYLTSTIVLLLINVILMAGIIRFIIGFRKVKNEYNYRLTPNGLELHNFSHFDSERGNIISKTNEDLNESVIINKRRISWVKILIIVLCCRPLSTEAYELIDSQIVEGKLFKYTLSLESSDKIQIGSQTISFVNSDTESRLIHMFTSYAWKGVYENKYYCLQSGCNKEFTCREDLLPFAKADSILYKEFPLLEGKPSYYSCKNMKAYCEFANGCMIMAFALNLYEDNKFEIYRISQQKRISKDLILPPGCYLDEYNPERSSGVDDMYYVEDNKGNGWFCHPSSYSHYPLPYSLGDLKVGQNGTINFISDYIKCSTDTFRDVFCTVPGSFLSHIDDYCVKNSPEDTGLIINRNPDSLTWPSEKTETIKISCDRDLHLVHSDHHCHKVHIEVWDTGNEQSDLLMSVYAESNSGIGVYILPDTVHAESHHFGCNGVWHNTFLLDLQSLNSSKIPYKYHRNIKPLTPEESQGMEVMPTGEDYWYNIGLGQWFKGVKEWFTGLSSISLMVVVIIFLVVVRR